MKSINLLSHFHCTIRGQTFGHSLGHVLCKSLKNLGFTLKIKTLPLNKDPQQLISDEDSATIILCDPHILACKKKLKSAGKVVLWNFEQNTLVRNKDKLDEILKADYFDYVWHYTNNGFIDNKKVFYMPCGYDDCMNGGSKKTHDLCFVGKLKGDRKKILDGLGKVYVMDKNNYNGLTDRLKNISKFRFSIFLPGTDDKEILSYVPCQRIMLLYANDVLLFSNIKFNDILEEKHYVYFDGKKDFDEKHAYYAANEMERKKVVDEAKEYLKKKYLMSDLLKNVMAKSGIN